MKITDNQLKEAWMLAMEESFRPLEQEAEHTAIPDNWETLFQMAENRSNENAKKHIRMKKIRRLQRTAAIFATSLLLGGGVLSVATAKSGYRQQGTNVITWTVHETPLKMQDIRFDTHGAEVPSFIETFYEPAYLPGGFTEDKEEALRNKLFHERIYKRDKQVIRFSQRVLKGGSLYINAEDMKIESVSVNGCKGQLNSKKDDYTLVWVTREYCYLVVAHYFNDKEELIKIAESVCEAGKDN